MGSGFSQHHENVDISTSAQSQHNLSATPLVPLYESSIQCSTNNNLNKNHEPSHLSINENIDDICYICSDPIKIYSVSPCGHRTCHLCALRTRVLLNSDKCAYCRTQQDEMLLTRDSKKSFQELKSSSSINWITISKINVLCEDSSIFNATIRMMEFRCPSKGCNIACKDWNDLSYHVRLAHNRMFCAMCIVNRKIFSSEHQLYTKEELINHYNGNNNNSTIDPYFQGHPSCVECNIHFYDSAELYDHYLIHHQFVPNTNLLRPTSHTPHHHITSSSQLQEHLIEASDIDIAFVLICIMTGIINVIGNITAPGCHDFERFIHSIENLVVTLMNHDNDNDQSFEILIILRNMASSLYMVGGRCLMLFMYLMLLFWVIKGWVFIMSWVIYGICIIMFGKICWQNLSKSFTSGN